MLNKLQIGLLFYCLLSE